MKRYNVIFTYNTIADNAGEALKLAEEVIGTGKDYFVEIYNDETNACVIDAAREDITIEEVKHED